VLAAWNRAQSSQTRTMKTSLMHLSLTILHRHLRAGKTQHQDMMHFQIVMKTAKKMTVSNQFSCQKILSSSIAKKGNALLPARLQYRKA
jgi:hypothetical protein